MDENKKPDAGASENTPHPGADPYAAPEKAPVIFTGKDWLFLPVSLLLA